MAMTIHKKRRRSQCIPGFPIIPMMKSISLPTETSTQPKNSDNNPHAHRSLTLPIPSSSHKDISTSILSTTPLETRLSLLYGANLDDIHSPVSPLDIDESPVHDSATYAAHPSAEDLHLSDPEADDSSDSGSELSFNSFNSSGRSSPVEGADSGVFALDEDEDDVGDNHEQDPSALPPLLLLHGDGSRASANAMSPETPRPYPLSLSDMFLRSVPDDFQGVVGDAFATHDPYMHSFDVVLARRRGAEAAPTVQVDPYERAWYAHDHIRSLSVTILASDGEDVNKTSKMGRFLLWVLEWAQRYSSTLEEVHITVPDSFPLPSDESSSGSCSLFTPNVAANDDSVEVLSNLKTLTWTGDTHILHNFLERFVPLGLHILKVENPALSVDDALLVVSEIAQHEIYALELGTLDASTPSSIGTDSDLKLPLCLPYLDSLKVCSSIPLERFFSALSLPSTLCKLEFDFTSAVDRVVDVVGSLISSEGLLEEYILFMDIEVEGAFEGMEEAMRRIKEKAAFAYVAFRGQVADEELGSDKV